MQMRAQVRRAIGAAAGAMLLLGTACRVHAEERVHAEVTREEPEKSRPIGAYVDTEMGAMSVILNTLAVDQAAPSVSLVRSQATGLMLGIGGGVRLGVVTLGPRLRSVALDGARVTMLGGELGVRFPIDRLEIRAALGGGHVSRSVDDPDPAQGTVPADGFYAMFSAGLGVRVFRFLTIAGGVNYNVIALTPSAEAGTALQNIATDVAAARASQAWDDARHLAGAGYGTALGFTVSIGAQF